MTTEKSDTAPPCGPQLVLLLLHSSLRAANTQHTQVLHYSKRNKQ